ncbi:MAG TPA: hypothetical protein PKW76_03875 [bacterium]|nr:hypothetical protein [bacterium]HPG44797.1 hypothetical protein [bacterium]HPM99682.1 hypothetical protein [bacterium]
MEKDIRIAIAEDIANRWNLTDIDYALIHGIEEYPKKIGRDLDVFVRKEHVDKAISISIEIFKEYGWFRVVDLPPIYGKRVIAFSDDHHNFLEIHTISKMTWFTVTFAQKPEPKYNVGPFKVDPWASIAKRFLMVILGSSDGGKKRYAERPAELHLCENEKDAFKNLSKYVGGKTTKGIAQSIFERNADKISSQRRKLQVRLLFYSLRNPFESIRNGYKYISNRILKYITPCAPIIAIVGPDGVGKTTLISSVRYQLPLVFNSILIKHWRPFLFPALGNIIGIKSGKPGPPRREAGRFYFFRMVYYYFDFLFGYYLKDATLTAEQRIIIYDRCWLDGWVDPLRYGFSSTWGIKFLYRILPKPDRVVLLYDDPERIHARKPELTKAEIREQLDKWMQLFREGLVDAVIRVDAQPEEMAQRLRELIIESFIEMNGGPIADSHEPLPWLEKALGVKISKRNGLSVSTKRFIHLPLPDGRGYILPTEPEAAVNSLSMYSPQKRKSKLAKSLLSIGLRTGIAQHLLPKLELHDFHPLADVIEQEFGRTDLHYAISLGTPGPHRKPVIKAMTRDHKTLGFVKVAWNDNSRKSVINECEILTHFACDKIDFIVPHILYNGEFKNQYISIQSSPKEGAFSSIKKLTEFHVNAVICMSKLHHREKNLPDSLFWQQIMSRIKSIKSPYMINVLHSSIHDIQDYFKSRPIIFHLSHGDFTPWNTVVLKNKLYIYDWEEATYERPAGYDLFHFLVSVLWLVENKSIEEINDFVIDELCNRIDYSKNTNISKQDTKYLFLIYQLDKLSFFLTHSYQSQICNFYSNLLMSRCISEI